MDTNYEFGYYPSAWYTFHASGSDGYTFNFSESDDFYENPLTEPPMEEGDNSVATKGTEEDPFNEEDLEDVKDHDDDPEDAEETEND